MRSWLGAMIFLCISWTLPTIVSAQTYDAALDFSATNNPTGVWSYGTKPVSNLGSGTFTLYPNVHNYLTDVRLWTHSTFPDVPFMSKNISASPVNQGTALWDPGQLAAHAGNATASVLRFTVPVTAIYNWHVTFTNQSFDFSGTQCYFYYNSGFQASYTLGTFGNSAGTGNVTSPLLNAGDILEFMVAPRADTSFNSTVTGLDVAFTIASVPEPTTYALIGTSVFIGAGLVWHRRRRMQSLWGNDAGSL